MKFKKVEIQAFKNYLTKENGTFDFTINKNVIADLVSIYAPNGFGKTSFYDAVDFCMTNNVSRFIRPAMRKINNNEGKKLKDINPEQISYVLRSNVEDDSTLDPTKVTIETEYGTFNRNLEFRKGNRDYIFDDNKTTKDRRYFRDVILSQEAIDTFLREDTPENRYKLFMDFKFGDSQDSFEYKRGILQEGIRQIEKNEKILKDKIGAITANFNIEVSSDIFLDTNTQIKLFNKEFKDKFNTQFDEINDTFDENKKFIFESKIKKTQEKIQGENSRLENQLRKLESISNKFPSLNRAIQKRSNLQLNVKASEKKSKDYQCYIKRIKEIEYLKNENYKLNNNINLLNKWMDYVPDYISAIKNNNSLISDIGDEKESLQIMGSTLNGHKGRVIEIKNQLASYKQQIKHLKDKEENSDLEFKKISDLEGGIEERNNKVHIIELRVARYNKLIDLRKSKVEEILSLGIEFKTSITSSEDYSFLLSISKKHLRQTNAVNELKDKNQLYKNRLKDAEGQNYLINELLQLGSRLVNTSKTNSCPLCKSPHKSFEELIRSINNNPSLDDLQKELLNKIDDTEREIENHENRIKDLNKDYIDAKEQLLKKQSLSINRMTSKNILFRTKTSRINFEIKQKEDALIKLNVETNNLTISKYRKEVSDQITVLNKSLSNNLNEAEELNKVIRGLESDIELKKKNHSELIAKLNYSSNLESQVSFEGFIQSIDIIKVKVDDLSVEELVNTLNGVGANHEKSLRDNIQLINRLSNKIDYFTEQHKHPTYDDSLKSELETILNTQQNELLNLNKYISNEQKSFLEFQIDIEELLPEHTTDIKDIIEYEIGMLTIDFESTISLNKLHLTEFLNILSTLNDVHDFIKQQNKEKEKEKLTEGLKELDSLKNTIKKDLGIIISKLENEIDRYFYTDLINIIYSKIDPHPEFKKVVFKPDFSEERAPKLQVFITDKDERNSISPTLHLSSAQINVLSLSIFLAKAVYTQNEEGQSVDCIFIDDPIQSMDSINILGLIDLVRGLITTCRKQIIISTHDENFHSLLKQRIPRDIFNAKYLKLETFGKVVVDNE